jgi:hypothetical protein
MKYGSTWQMRIAESRLTDERRDPPSGSATFISLRPVVFYVYCWLIVGSFAARIGPSCLS